MKNIFFLLLITMMFVGCSTSESGSGGLGNWQSGGSGMTVPGDSTTRAFPSEGRISTGAH